MDDRINPGRGAERGRSGEARDPNRPTYVDPDTSEVEKEGLGPRDAEPETDAGDEMDEDEGADDDLDSPS